MTNPVAPPFRAALSRPMNGVAPPFRAARAGPAARDQRYVPCHPRVRDHVTVNGFSPREKHQDTLGYTCPPLHILLRSLAAWESGKGPWAKSTWAKSSLTNTLESNKIS